MTPRCSPPEDVLRALVGSDPEGDEVRAHVASCAQCGQIAADLERSMREVRREWGGPVSGERGAECPSEDALAALADGALTGEARARVVRHLADCARCSAEVAALVGALGDPAVRAEMERLERGWLARPRTWGVAGALAAAAVLVVVVRGRVNSPSATPWDIAALASQATGAKGAPSGWTDIGWSVTRGSGIGAVSSRSAAFRVGVRLVDLRVAVESGDVTMQRRWSGELGEILAALPLADPARAQLVQLDRAIGAGAPADSVRAIDQRVEAAARYAGDASVVQAGAWIEAARIAVLSGRVSVLQADDLRRAIAQLRAPNTAATSDSLVNLLTPDGVAAELPVIRRLLDAIAQAAGG